MKKVSKKKTAKKKTGKRKAPKKSLKNVKSKKIFKLKPPVDDWGEGFSINEYKKGFLEYKSCGNDYEFLIDEKCFNKNGELIPTINEMIKNSSRGVKTKQPKDTKSFLKIKLWEVHEAYKNKIYPSSAQPNNQSVSLEFSPDIFKSRYRDLRKILYSLPKEAIKDWETEGKIPIAITVGRRSKQLERRTRYHSRFLIYKEIAKCVYKTITKNEMYIKDSSPKTYRKIHTANKTSIIKECLFSLHNQKILNWASMITKGGKKTFKIDSLLIEKLYNLALPRIGVRTFNFEYIERRIKRETIKDAVEYEGMSVEDFKRNVLRGSKNIAF